MSSGGGSLYKLVEDGYSSTNNSIGGQRYLFNQPLVNRVMKHLNGTEYNKEFSGM
jgi:hypothetical protein